MSHPIAFSSNHFNQQLLPIINANHFVYSPLSITIALLMVYFGSRENTKKQLQSLFQINNSDNQLATDILQIIKSNDIQVGESIYH